MRHATPSLSLLIAGAIALAGACAPVQGGGGSDGDLGDVGGDAGVACASDGECDDGIACTIDHCESGSCIHEPCADCCQGEWECIVTYGCGLPPAPCTTDEECIDETPCTLDRCRDRSYCEHLPQPGLCEEGEICLAALGCIPSPPSDCDSDEDCNMGRPCLGEWYCDPEFACQFLSLVNCSDDDECTDDSCDDERGGCVHVTRDGDGDGHGDSDCGGDDCNDADPLVSPSAIEICNEADDDCDGDVDEGCCPEGEACLTECGSTGAIECSPSGEQSCAPPLEACNGEDDDCDGAVDNGFACVAGSAEPCITRCSSEGSRDCQADCTWDLCVPPGELCNGLDDNCNDAADETFFCPAGSPWDCTLLGYFSGTALCLDDCSAWDEAACSNCGDGDLDTGEECDGTDLDGLTCETLSTASYAGGTLRCGAGCRLDTVDCHHCGNGVVDVGEECDGSALGGRNCRTVPGTDFGGGTLDCDPDCYFDTSRCHDCGNGAIDVGEDCDGGDLGGNDCTTITGGFDGGSLDCSALCAFGTSSCTASDPSGTYALDPDPSYQCALIFGFYQIDFTITTFSFVDDGSTLEVRGAPCGGGHMVGASVAADGSFFVTCTYSGDCNETYSLSGTFTDADSWTGDFTASYSGFCLDCTEQAWTITGTR